jgi:hypothetical protein
MKNVIADNLSKIVSTFSDAFKALDEALYWYYIIYCDPFNLIKFHKGSQHDLQKEIKIIKQDEIINSDGFKNVRKMILLDVSNSIDELNEIITNASYIDATTRELFQQHKIDLKEDITQPQDGEKSYRIILNQRSKAAAHHTMKSTLPWKVFKRFTELFDKAYKTILFMNGPWRASLAQEPLQLSTHYRGIKAVEKTFRMHHEMLRLENAIITNFTKPVDIEAIVSDKGQVLSVSVVKDGIVQEYPIRHNTQTGEHAMRTRNFLLPDSPFCKVARNDSD